MTKSEGDAAVIAPLVRVGELAEQIRGVSYAKADVSSVPRPGYLPVLRAGNITNDGLAFSDLVFVPAVRISTKQRIRKHDVVIAASSGSVTVVGKAAPALGDYEGGFGAFCKVLRPGPKVDPRYFSHFFKTQDYRLRISALAAGININNLRGEHLDDMQVRLPPLLEQRRIAEVLDRAEALRAKRRAALAQLDTLTESIFLDMFGDPEANPRHWAAGTPLGEVSEIVSGITVGRRVNGQQVRTVRYLAVVNVQDKALDLSVAKTIDATDDEIRRFRLRADDLLLTEGGDPDKLGRGTLWKDEVPECIHQNHIFRVRLTSGEVDPLFLNWLVGSKRGKRYFLKSAKQTTGIASINMTQLRGFPLLIPPMALQREFGRRIAGAEELKSAYGASLAESDALFSSLQHRAFAGQL
jgi:type I restriction enzyme S subunit